MEAIRKTLFESTTLQIGTFEARPVSDACGDVERQALNVVALPYSGVFSKHEAPRRHVLGTSSHAVFIAADAPYRLSFPGAIGDRALILRFENTLAPDLLDPRSRGEALASHGLLPPKAMILRNRLLVRSQEHETDRFEIEALGLDLLTASLRSLRMSDVSLRRTTLQRWLRAIARVKEAVAVAPSERWSVAKLATIADVSPFHLCHVFRRITGVSLHDYVLQERLAYSLHPVVDSDSDLISIALDAGFASHSHFTARFRRFFGCTPAALRRAATVERVRHLRKIVTARRTNLPQYSL